MSADNPREDILSYLSRSPTRVYAADEIRHAVAPTIPYAAFVQHLDLLAAEGQVERRGRVRRSPLYQFIPPKPGAA